MTNLNVLLVTLQGSKRDKRPKRGGRVKKRFASSHSNMLNLLLKDYSTDNIFKKELDKPGIEPGAFPLRRERDTTTPFAQYVISTCHPCDTSQNQISFLPKTRVLSTAFIQKKRSSDLYVALSQTN